MPVSDTESRIHSPGGIPGKGGRSSGSSVSFDNRTSNSPFFGMASCALTARAVITCCIWVGSALTRYSPRPISRSMRMLSGIVRFRNLMDSLRKGTRSRGLRWMMD